jgi:CheY-like chemotaxis protein
MNSIGANNILIIEDDPADQKLIKTSLKSQQVASDFNIAGTAEEALDFLLFMPIVMVAMTRSGPT